MIFIFTRYTCERHKKATASKLIGFDAVVVFGSGHLSLPYSGDSTQQEKLFEFIALACVLQRQSQRHVGECSPHDQKGRRLHQKRFQKRAIVPNLLG